MTLLRDRVNELIENNYLTDNASKRERKLAEAIMLLVEAIEDSYKHSPPKPDEGPVGTIAI